jgi:hypothetical protein
MRFKIFRKKESEDSVLSALQSRLDEIEKEITHVTNLASSLRHSEANSAREREHWDLARQLQQHAREIRDAMRTRQYELRMQREDSGSRPRAKSSYSYSVFTSAIGGGFLSSNCR